MSYKQTGPIDRTPDTPGSDKNVPSRQSTMAQPGPSDDDDDDDDDDERSPDQDVGEGDEDVEGGLHVAQELLGSVTGSAREPAKI